MAYIGEKPSQTLASPTSQYFNGDGSTVAFTLNRPVNAPEDLEVFVNNIQQEPGVGKSYTATGTTLTFDAAPSAGTANVYVVYRGLAEVTTRLEHDPNSAISATTGTFTGDLTVDTNTLKVDSTNNLVGIGTASPNNNLHIQTASGNPELRVESTGADYATVSVKNSSRHYSTQIRTDQSNAYVVRDETGAGNRLLIDTSGRVTTPSQPSFFARNTSGSHNNGDVILFNQIYHNNGSHYNTANGRFTAPVAGYYFFYTTVCWNRTTSTIDFYCDIKHNGNVAVRVYTDKAGGANVHPQQTGQYGNYLNANDYIEVQAISGGAIINNGNHCSFGGYLYA